MKLKFLMSFSTLILVSLGGFSDDLADLDANLMRERLKKIHGDFSVKATGEWKVSSQGKVQTWKWTAKGWVCPAEPILSCGEEWVPTSFKWWSQGRGWAESWSPVKKLGYEFGRPKLEVAKPVVTEVHTLEETPAADGDVEQADPFAGKKWALESWLWKNKKESEAKIFISLREQAIERIDTDGAIEYLDWISKPGRSALQLGKVVIEKNGIRATFSRS